MNKNYNILFIGAIDFPFNTAGSNLIRRLFTPLAEKGYSIELLLVRGALDQFNQGTTKNKKEEYQGIKYQYCSFRNKPRNFFLKFIEIFIGSIVSSFLLVKRILQNRVDIVFIYTGYPYLNLPVVLLSKICRKKIIKLSVDWYVKKQVVHKPYYIFKWWLFIFEISALDKLLDGVIVLNKNLKDHYLKIRFKENQVIVIPSIIDLNEFNFKHPKDNAVFTIGYCGAAPYLNGVGDLIEAFYALNKEYKNIKLLIVGDSVGKGSDLYQFKEQVNKLGIAEQVKFTGRIPSAEVVNYLSKCTVLTLPRKKTKFADSGFPTKLSEYFAMEKPVVLSRVGDFEYYFQHKQEVVFCEPDNPASLKEAIQFLLENKNDAQKIAANGYAWAKNNINSKLIANKLLHFIKHL